MEQEKINMEPGNGTPTADLRIVAPIELRSLYVAVGTIIMAYGRTFLCVPISSTGDIETDIVACTDCDAPWTLCHMMRCDARQRPDGANVQFKIIALHE